MMLSRLVIGLDGPAVVALRLSLGAAVSLLTVCCYPVAESSGASAKHLGLAPSSQIHPDARVIAPTQRNLNNDTESYYLLQNTLHANPHEWHYSNKAP